MKILDETDMVDAVFKKSLSIGRKEDSDTGEYSATLGENLIASGKGSFSSGGSTIVTADYGHGEGCNYNENGYDEQVVVSGVAGHGEGRGTKVTKEAGHAEGILTNVSAKAGHAEGEFSFSGGEASHAQNIGTAANAKASSASGLFTTANGEAQHVQGKYNKPDSDNKYAHIIGGGTENEEKNIHTVDWEGNAEYSGDVIAHGCEEENPASLLGVASIINQEYEFIPINMDSIGDGKNKYFQVLGSNIANGDASIEDAIIIMNSANHCVYHEKVKKGDCLMMTNAHDLDSATPYVMIFDKNGIYTTSVTFTALKNQYKNKYTFEQDGSFYICFVYTAIQSGEFFYIKRTHRKEPFVLYAEKAESYVDDADTGEAVMKAIMEGRQIVVRVPNADGGNYMALYSPVLMYQLPNYLARHLYLFYLNDGVNEMGLPSYNQLKIAVSRDYNQTPLS